MHHLSLDLYAFDYRVLETTQLKPFLELFGNVTNLSLRLRDGNCRKNPDFQYQLLRYSNPKTAWTNLQSLTLHSLTVVPQVLHRLVNTNASTLRVLRATDCGLKLSVVTSLATIPKLNLSDIHITERFVPRSEKVFVSSTDLCLFLRDKSSFQANIQHGRQEKSVLLDACVLVQAAYVDTTRHARTQRLIEDDDVSKALDYAETDGSNDSLPTRHPTAPKWAWGRYFNDDDHPEGRVMYWPAEDADTEAQPTVWWKFVNRHGETAIGDEPLTWFDDWDVDTGDREFPTPFCHKLLDFYKATEMRKAVCGIDMRKYLGALASVQPPTGAAPCDEHEDWELALACQKANRRKRARRAWH